MVVAIVYDNETGNVAGHFGHAKNFKLYEIEDGRILDSAVVEPIGQGHDAVIMTMLDYSVSVVISSSMGEHAAEGLQNAGIAICPNVEGRADDAIEALMNGSLQVLAGDVEYAGCASSSGCCGDSATCGSSCAGCH